MTHKPRIARIYFSLRTAHLERFRQLDPSTLIYRKARYDFDPSAAGPGTSPQQMGRGATVWHLLTHSYDVVEVNEPAVAWLWGDLLLQTAAVRLRAWITRTPTAIVTYCIAVVEPAHDAINHRMLPRPLVGVLSGPVMRLLVRSMTRITFGTTASREMYVGHVGRPAIAGRARTFEAVPAPCPCLDSALRVRDERSVVFVGAFTERKGIGQLMDVWEGVSLRRKDLRLTIIGKGEREAEVRAWATSRPEVTVVVDPPRDEIHQSLREAACVILLSQRVGTWREEVGLPIVEALAHGCEVVTTDETGLAPWLCEHGHAVMAAGCAPEPVVAQVLRRVDDPRSEQVILEQLPREDQRLAADRWMVSGLGNRSECSGSGARDIDDDQEGARHGRHHSPVSAVERWPRGA